MAFLSATAIHQKEVILLTHKLCLFCCKPTGQGVQTSTPNLKVHSAHETSQPNGFSQGRRQRTTTGSGRGPLLHPCSPPPPRVHETKEEQTTGSGRPPLFFCDRRFRGPVEGEQRCKPTAPVGTETPRTRSARYRPQSYQLGGKTWARTDPLQNFHVKWTQPPFTS